VISLKIRKHIGSKRRQFAAIVLLGDSYRFRLATLRRSA
jgi:hypothetical protein